MQTIATYQRKTFLKDHPPIIQRMILHSDDTPRPLLAGTVLGEKDGKRGAFTSGATPCGILVADTAIPASGDIYALVYVHAEVIAAELIWDKGVTAAEQQTAINSLRSIGVYANEA